MRDFLYHGAWLGLLPLSFYSAHLGILLWIWAAMLPPADLMYGTFGVVLPFNKLAAASVFISLLARPQRKFFYFDFLMGVVASYVLIVTASYLLAPEHSGVADVQYDKLWKELVLAFLITGIMYTRHRLHQVALVMSIAFGFYMAKEGLIFLLTAGGHHVDGSGVTGDNNGLALALLMLVPILLFVAKYTAERWIQLGMYITAGLGAVTVIATYSRGGFIGLITLGFMLLKGSKHRIRNLALIAAVGLLLYQLMPDDYLTRMDTIAQADEDDSFTIRLVAWKINLLMALDRPLLGFGPFGSLLGSNWFTRIQEASTFLFPTPIINRTFVAHSIYFQALGDTGFLGLFLFLLMLTTALFYTIATQRRARRDPALTWAADLARATQIATVVYMVCGAALSNIYFEPLYLLLALTSRVRQTVRVATAPQRLPMANLECTRAVSAFEPAEVRAADRRPRTSYRSKSGAKMRSLLPAGPES
ncbi:MAG: putative O-glycosylation ligase, exosortase A system-associated [Acetobacteraceae bacterium]|nr:putative O-glycosylation ligase, exosortase A system-associated [Acetobacteraceae bacterium]